MRIQTHATAGALPSILLFWEGSWAMALFFFLGSVAPDLTWVQNELQYRRFLRNVSGSTPFREWVLFLPEEDITPYRLAHSFLVTLPVFLSMSVVVGEVWVAFSLGWILHLLLDLPTHSGRMTQLPLYPYEWRWPWVLPSYR